MKRRGIGICLGVLGLMAAFAATLAGEAGAQYPPAIGGVIVSSGDATPGPNETVAVSATVVDEAGNPIAGASCSFSISEQPGGDASVEAGPFTTDSAGEVSTTLQSGSLGGEIVVKASCCLASAAGQPNAI